MSTVKITYSGPVALAQAQPDYTPEDWDTAAQELGRRGYWPNSDTADIVLEDGTEVFVFAQKAQRDLIHNLDGFDVVLIQAKQRA